MEPLKFEGIWRHETGCMVKVGDPLFRKEYVPMAPTNPVPRRAL
jgi:hypothetical protein